MGWQVQLTWLAACLAVTFCILENTQNLVFGPNKPSVFFIKSHFGNFFMAFNKTIALNNTGIIVLPTNSTCQCRVQCRAHPQCQAWSNLWLDGVGECRLGLGGPHDHWVTDHDGATYYFKEDSPQGTYRYREDGLLYLESDYALGFLEAREYCERIPGHRMAAFRTPQQWSFVYPHRYPVAVTDRVHLGLMKNDALQPEHLDGTLFDMSILLNPYMPKTINSIEETVYVLHSGEFKDVKTDFPMTVWCQANIFGVEW